MGHCDQCWAVVNGAVTVEGRPVPAAKAGTASAPHEPSVWPILVLSAPGLSAAVAETVRRSMHPRRPLLTSIESWESASVFLAVLVLLPLVILWVRQFLHRPVVAFLLLAAVAPTFYFSWPWLGLILFYAGIGYRG